ncbi:MAG: hypothetical protein ACO1QB_16950, partial [Verrucomicrobiales bacterium]
KIEISEVGLLGSGRKLRATQAIGSNSPEGGEQAAPEEPDLTERILGRGNMLKAMKAVEMNRGAAGVDGVEVHDLRTYVQEHWAGIQEQILKGAGLINPPRYGTVRPVV